MHRSRALGWLGILLMPMLISVGCQRTETPTVDPANAVEGEPPGVPYQITGPYAHENLTVFLLHSPTQDEREFITLDQGLKDGIVKITEKDQEQVQELQIENQSEKPLFLQEGDRLQGGKQDRTIYASLVIPPKSGKMAVPTFCIEQSRWVVGNLGNKFEPTANAAFAPRATREAAKYGKSQDKVWESVWMQKTVAEKNNLALNNNSSLNETLDSPQVKKLSEDYAKALANALEKHPDAVGVAIAINGNIEEVNVYPNHSLLSKLYPRLLQSYALEATLEKDKAKDAKPVTSADLEKFLATAKSRAKRDEIIDASNSLTITDCDGVSRGMTCYRGAVVHEQILKKSAPAEDPANQQPVSGKNP
jgi:hypothetical protein